MIPKIVGAKKSDFKEFARIYVEGFSEEYGEEWTIPLAVKKFEIFSKYCDIYKLVLNNETIGFIVLNPNQWRPGTVVFGEDFAIKSKYRGKGFGKYALNWVEEEYRKKGFKRFLFTSLKASNAYKIYKSLGYVESRGDVLFEKELE